MLSIVFRVTNMNKSMRLSFMENFSVRRAFLLVSVMHPLILVETNFKLTIFTRFNIRHFEYSFIRLHVLTVFMKHPARLVSCFLHFKVLMTFEIGVYDQFILSSRKWIENGELDIEGFPFVIDGNVFQVF